MLTREERVAWRAMGGAPPVYFANACIGVDARRRGDVVTSSFARIDDGTSDVSEAYAVRALAGLPAPDVATWLDGVGKLRAGDALVRSSGALDVRRHVAGDARESLQVPRPKFEGTPRDAALQLRGILERRLVDVCSGRRVAVLVSGGLDSTLVVALVRDLVRRGVVADLRCWTLDVDENAEDRRSLATLAAALDLRVRRVTPEEAARGLPGAMVVDGFPATSPAAAWDLAMARAAKEGGADVLLTGVGSDELLDGSLDHFQALARAGHPIRALRMAEGLSGPWGSSVPGAWYSLFVRPWIRGLVPPRLRRRRARRHRIEGMPWLTPRVWKACGGADDEWVPLVRPLPETDFARIHDVATSAWADARAEARTQTESEVGLPIVDAFLDPTLMNFLGTLPPGHFFEGGRLRGLVRAAMPDDVPAAIRHRLSKDTFDVAALRVARAAHEAGAFSELLPLTHVTARRWVDGPTFREAFASALEDRTDSVPLRRLWPVLALEAFLARRCDRLAASPNFG